jgi:hypothetical protein
MSFLQKIKHIALLNIPVVLTVLLMSGLLHSLVTASPLAPAATYVSGNITQDTTWTIAGSPYVMTETVTVAQGVTLTIEAGVTIMASGGTGYAMLSIEEGAHLDAVGTPATPIVFTSVTDSGPGEWTSVVIVGSANIQNAHFRNSEFNLDIWGASGGQVVLQDCLISHSSMAGMYVAVDALHRLEMSNVTFLNNAQNRIRIMHYSDGDQLVGDVLLKPMPGLEGYEYYLEGSNVTPILKVPPGVTFTLNADTRLIMPEFGILHVGGNLQVPGELDHPVTFTPTDIIPSVPGYDLWTGIVFDETGSGMLSHADIRYAGAAGVGVFGSTDSMVKVENSTIADGHFGIISSPDALHRLEMNNVTFANNVFNRVGLEVGTGFDTFSADTVLTAQPGLEGYSTLEDHDRIVVPTGVTVTMKPGAALFLPDLMRIEVEGSFYITGSATQTATIRADSGATEWTGIMIHGGAAVIAHGQLMDAETAVSLHSSAATLTVTNSTFTQNYTGILANFGRITAVCTTFTQNTFGVHLEPGGMGNVNVHQSNLSSNITAGMNNESDTLISAANNWWGAADGPSGDAPGSGDAIFGNVQVVPWQAVHDCHVVSEYQLFVPFVIRSELGEN